MKERHCLRTGRDTATDNVRTEAVSDLRHAITIWERRGGSGRNVTFPARQYSVNGERRSFALLRPIVDTTAQHAARYRILEAYAEFEQRLDASV